MLWKSLAIACLSIVVTTAAAQSLDRTPKKRSNTVAPAVSSMSRLQQKLGDAIESGRYPEVERIARQILIKDPDNRLVISYLGNALAAQSKFAQAESLYRQQIAKNKFNFPIYRELGKVLEKQGKLDAAATIYRQAIALTPANSYIDLSEINHSLVAVLIRLGRSDEAIAFGKQRLAVSDNELEIFTLGTQLSDLLEKRGKLDESNAIFRQMLAKAPSDIFFATIATQLGEQLIEQGKESEAIELYQQTIARISNKTEDFSNYNHVYSTLGKLLEKQNRLPEALVVYRKSIANSRTLFSQFVSQPEALKQLLSQLEKSQDTETFNLAFDYLPMLGSQMRINEILYRKQGLQAVRQEMQPIVQTTPEIAAFVWRSFGDRRIAAKQYQDAISAYQQAIQLDKNSNNVRVQGNLFLALTLVERPEEAKVAYQKIISLTPAAKRSESIKNWALALDKAGRKTEAIDLYRQFLKSPGKDYLFISLQLAGALEQSGKTAEATAKYEEVKVALAKLQRSAPKDPQTWTMQGNFFDRRQQHQAAIESYRKAIGLLEAQKDKKDAKLLSFSQLKLADNLRASGKHPDAIGFYRQAIAGCDCTELKRYQPSTLHGMAYHGLGLSLELQGQRSEAKAAFQKALELDASYDEAKNNLNRMNAATPVK